MTIDEVTLLIRELQYVFDIVRLVDVAMTTQYAPDGEGHLTPGAYECYAVWNKEGRCENCVSARAFRDKTRMTKYEFIGDKVYYVVAKYIEVDEKPYVLEIVSNVTDEVLFGALGKARLIEAIQTHNDLLYRDPLTGAYNREYYEQQLAALQYAGALAMVDVDNFKSINDTFGHQAGDRALQLVVRTFQKHIRSCDAVIRYGGDEFLLVFQQMKEDEFAARLESLRALVSEARVPEYPEMRVTVSIGGSGVYEPGVDRIRRADTRLYKAKEQKNAVCCDMEGA